MTNLLRDNLHHEAEQVALVDLVDRVRRGSAQAKRRRAIAITVSGFVLAVALAGSVLAWPGLAAPTPADTPTLGPTPSYAPLPAPHPSPTPADLWRPASDPPADTSLDGVVLTVPYWPGVDSNRSCAGDVVLSRGVFPFPQGTFRELRLLRSVSEGPTGVVALFYCELGDVGRQFQVVSYQRDDAGRLRVRGPVLASDPSGVVAMFDVAVAGSEIRIEVGDWAGGGSVGEASHYSVHQWRAYAWNGTVFGQVGGPTSFAPNPNLYHIRVRSDDVMTLGELRNGQRQATLHVTVGSDGPSTATHVIVTVAMPGGADLSAVDSPACPPAKWLAESTADSRRRFSCDLGTLPTQSTVELVLTFSVSGAHLPDFTAPVGGGPVSPKYGEVSAEAAGVSLAPQDYPDNVHTFRINF